MNSGFFSATRNLGRALEAVHLKGKSHGKDASRYLIISRKVSPWNLVKEVSVSGETSMYRVIPPGREQDGNGTPKSDFSQCEASLLNLSVSSLP